MGRVYPVGHERTTVPVPPVEADTIYIDAGPISFGVEYRFVNDDIMTAHLANDPDAHAAHWAVREEVGVAAGEPDDYGPSVHIFDSETRLEYVRFDLFEADPHYHYIRPGKGHLAVAFDDIANVPYAEWVLTAIARRTPEMLRRAGAEALADRVDAAAVAAAVPQVAAALDRVARQRAV